jgi:uncharacterized protein (DUF983 family)
MGLTKSEKAPKGKLKSAAFSVLVSFVRWIHPRCPSCKEGRLWNSDIELLSFRINGWCCDKCNDQFF